MRKICKFVSIVLCTTFLGGMISCGSTAEPMEIETKTNVDVPESTTDIKLEPAMPAQTCRAERYDMELRLDTEQKQLFGTVSVELVNRTQDVLRELCFRTDAASDMEIKNVMIEGAKKQPATRNKKEVSAIYADISHVPLNPGESITITMDFMTEIPNEKSRFGYTINGKDTIYQLTFCFPRIAMYENGTWDESPYTNSGAENNHVTVSDYHVTFEAPREFTVIASGDEKTNGNITEITGENLRQLAIFAGSNIEVNTEIIHNTAINHYSFDHDGNKEYYAMALDAAKDSFHLFSTLIGDYPYKELDVIHGYYNSAMEYSGVILMGMPDVKDVTELDEHATFSDLCSRVAHEVAHQWFYGVVGNDPYEEPWLDEALAEYCEDILYQQSKLPSIASAIKYDQKFNGSDIWGTMSEEEFHQYMDGVIEQLTGDSFIISKSYKDYDVENQEYSSYVYDGGTYFLYELRKAMGDGVFFPMLQEYYKAYSFKECTTQDFIKMVQRFDDSEDVKRILKKYLGSSNV